VAAGESPPGGWDFFVSYTQADRAWAEWIAWILEEDGHRVLVQAWDFVPGTNWVQGMQAGTRDAARTIAVLSGEYLASVYGEAEWQAAWASDPAGTGRKLLTVRVAECDRPGLLAGVVGVDLFGLGEAAAKARLRVMVSKAIKGRAKPEVRPRFPGAGRAMPRAARFPGALPQVWKVPARNPNFTGRGVELEELARALAAGAATVHSVRGMGGVGKTQLAAEYAHAHASDYDLVWWVAAEVPAAIPDQFAALADRLGLDPAADPEALRALVHNRLRTVPGWLLIFDNADRVEDIRLWLPGGPLAPGIPGHVIVTTRRGGFAAMGTVMDLDVISLPDAVRILQARVPGLGQETAGKIAEELGRLPLALEQAAAWLDRSQMPGPQYLELLRSRGADLHARGQVSGRADTIATLWEISVGRITAENPASVQLLGVCAYLAPEPVPLDLFAVHADLLPEPLASVAADQVAFGEAIAVLVDYSLAKRTLAGLQMHRLVQATIRARDGSGPAARPPAARKGYGRWRRKAPEPAMDSLAVALRLLSADVPAEVQVTLQAWPRWAVLLPHVLAATGHADHASSQPSPAVMTDVSRLLERAGTYLRMHVRLTDAKALQERALAIDETAYGPDHPNVAADLNNLAQVLRDLGQLQQARPLQERALAIDEAALGPDHPNVATHLNNLALIVRDLGHPEQARPLQERALGIDEAALGPDHPEVATRLNTLALIVHDLGQPEQARPLQERALGIDEAAYGPDHPEIARDLTNLAVILHDLGQPEQARPLQERALGIDEAAYGPVHPAVARGLNNLAWTLRVLGQPEQARPLQERALGIDEAAYGPDHPEVAARLDTLAQILRDLGQPEQARPLLERALAIEEARQSGRYRPD
jgi:tetratricopeptide (TPR) repeat protein